MKIQYPIKVAVIAYDGANAVDIFGPLQVFASANEMYKRMHSENFDIYEIKLFSLTQLQIKLHTGTSVLTDGVLDDLVQYQADTIMISGGEVALSLADQPEVISQLLPIMDQARRVSSVCSGAFILAATGLMENRQATTHWGRYEEFSTRFPSVKLNIDALFTKDDKYYCSAGVTSGIDLSLYLIQEDYGHRIALETSREMVAFYHRPGGQNQFSSIKTTVSASSDAIVLAQNWIDKNLNKVLMVSQLAELVAMSVRNFSRKFTLEIGLPPSRYITKARFNKARLLLEENNTSIQRIAYLCGYENSESFRRLFKRELNISPSEYRKRFHI
ncbi:GlxA family transcriptional regulator [Psychromonas sp. SR45-3]|uniref:GlxA family transcriptional regulator n=1 Tax=Psychromonas sp. SR45-3 TaxID=2760930 RepID=UPI001C71E94D|nr:helix-turn-helix domain-containing protein [Psychromonas sp. SR45-3]